MKKTSNFSSSRNTSSSKDLTKDRLYEGVKLIAESSAQHLHLYQAKLYTLFSLAFQYLLFKASKEGGVYLIRIEDSFLAEKISYKAKDPSSRKFMNQLIPTRKLRYANSLLYLDYFNPTSWSLTKDLPAEKMKMALIVKNTSPRPFIEDIDYRELGEHFYLETLVQTLPKTLCIGYGQDYSVLEPKPEQLRFEFIPDKIEVSAGVKILDDDILDS